MKSEILQHARAEVAAMPLDQLDVSDPALYRDDTVGVYFDRLREEAPVHYRKDGMYGSFWSITRFGDIVEVDKNHAVFSSDSKHGGITIWNRGKYRQNFLNMDPPRHDEYRKVVSPIVAPDNLARLEGFIRSRAVEILESLPVGEEFDWVEHVSRNLTTQMLATLFDVPPEDRHMLPVWSDMAIVDVNAGTSITSEESREEHLKPCYDYFAGLWNERVNKAPGSDLISMLAHSETARTMTQDELRGTIILLIIGGNDTTRNSISGGLLALNENPDEYRKLRGDPGLVPNMVSEIIRWQTPLSHMRRTAVRDVEFGGQAIREGDKVVMWYLSGNRDARVIPDADRFLIDRRNARHHLSFGFGIHRCVGNRLAELQLRILWEEILRRSMDIEVTGEPVRTYSNFVHGIESLPVRIRR